MNSRAINMNNGYTLRGIPTMSKPRCQGAANADARAIRATITPVTYRLDMPPYSMHMRQIPACTMENVPISNIRNDLRVKPFGFRNLHNAKPIATNPEARTPQYIDSLPLPPM